MRYFCGIQFSQRALVFIGEYLDEFGSCGVPVVEQLTRTLAAGPSVVVLQKPLELFFVGLVCVPAGLVVEGLPNKLIADQLDISVRTVEVHRSRVFEKMSVKSAVELANLLREV